MTEIARFMLLPHVQVLEAMWLDKLRSPQLPPPFAAMTSTLEIFTLTGSDHCSLEVVDLLNLLSYTPSLKILTCEIPTGATSYRAVCGRRKLVGPISPRGMQCIIDSVCDTLEELTLKHSRFDVLYDGSHLDFSKFPLLRKLEVASGCLLPSGPPHHNRNLLPHLLPTSLRNLKVSELHRR